MSSYIDSEFNVYKTIEDCRYVPPIFECDELMAPIICILNRKGYKTKYCCSGHVNNDIYNKDEVGLIVNNNSCYIAFEDDPKTLTDKRFVVPKGFKIEMPMNDVRVYDYLDGSYIEPDWGCIIRKTYRNHAPRFIQMLNTARVLYLWAEQLPIMSERNKKDEEKQ